MGSGCLNAVANDQFEAAFLDARLTHQGAAS
jgi:hypothetical protein